MKVSCKTHGAHFSDEFKSTLTCSFWEDRGLKDLKRADKKLIWDWLFSFNFDDFAGRTGKALSVEWWGVEYEGNVFDKVIEDYKNWPDEKRKEFQKAYSKWMFSLDQDFTSKIILNYFAEAIWKNEKKL